MRTSSSVAILLLIAYCGLSFPLVHGQSDQITGNRKVVSRVLPEYPRLARSMNLKGTVRLEVLVAENGVAKSVQVKGGSPVLVQSAQDAVHGWRWEKTDHATTEMVEFNFSPD